jgi:hypothetical protein
LGSFGAGEGFVGWGTGPNRHGEVLVRAEVFVKTDGRTD